MFHHPLAFYFIMFVHILIDVIPLDTLAHVTNPNTHPYYLRLISIIDVIFTTTCLTALKSGLQSIIRNYDNEL